MKHKLLGIIVPIADHLAAKGIYPLGNNRLTEAIKTEAFYNRTLKRLTRTFYQGFVTELDFVGIFADLVSGQMRRAYIEGLQSVGFSPGDMTARMFAEIDQITSNEHDFVLSFIQEVIDAKGDETGFEQFLPRIDTWSNRYRDVVNRGTLAGARRTGTFLIWELGPTEHCTTCLGLNGMVAHPFQWTRGGVLPQRPPNSELECGGWRCQCTLKPTDKPITVPPGVIEELEEAGISIPPSSNIDFLAIILAAYIALLRRRKKLEKEEKEKKAIKGGPGSGHFGHSGRPGAIGGSLPGGGGGGAYSAGNAADLNNGVRELDKSLQKFITVYTKEEYNEMDAVIYLSEDKKSGFAIKPDGELISVFSSVRGRGNEILTEAVSLGATKLDYFEDPKSKHLTNLYSKFGFNETERLEWDEQYAPPGWDRERFNEPDVVIAER